MNRLLQKHGCDTVFKVPDGLGELLSDISREVLRAQPENIIEFIAKYLTTLLITRENGLLSIRLLKDVCLCQEGLEHEFIKIGFETTHAKVAADLINLAFEEATKAQGEEINEKKLIVQLLRLKEMTKEEINIIFLVLRKAFKDYQRRMQALKQALPPDLNEPWQKAAEETIKLYETTRPTVEELQRASTKIQAAYRGYYVRRNCILREPELSNISSESVDDDAGARETTFGYKILLLSKTDEPWDVGAERTIKLYEKTRPSIAKLHRASTKIQAAYRGYCVRRDAMPLKHKSTVASSCTMSNGAGTRESLVRHLKSAVMEHNMERGDVSFNIFSLQTKMKTNGYEENSPKIALQNMEPDVQMCLKDILRATEDYLLYTAQYMNE